MEIYQNLGGDAGVVAYKLLTHGILLEFEDGSIYRYDEKSCGLSNIRAMKKLAQKGEGLTTYLNIHVREKYAARLK